MSGVPRGGNAHKLVLAALAFACFAALAGCDSPSIPLTTAPYDFRLLVPAGIGDSTQFRTFHWGRGSEVPVLVEEIPSLGRPSLREAFAKAAETWNQAAVFSEVRLRETSDPGEALAVLMWEDTEPRYTTPSGCTGPTTGAAATRGCLTEDVESLQIWARRDGGSSRMTFRVSINQSPGMDDDFLEVLVTHEMGHVLGVLAHSNSSQDLMWGGAIESPLLSATDRLTLRSLYQSRRDLEVGR